MGNTMLFWCIRSHAWLDFGVYGFVSVIIFWPFDQTTQLFGRKDKQPINRKTKEAEKKRPMLNIINAVAITKKINNQKHKTNDA